MKLIIATCREHSTGNTGNGIANKWNDVRDDNGICVRNRFWTSQNNVTQNWNFCRYDSLFDELTSAMGTISTAGALTTESKFAIAQHGLAPIFFADRLKPRLIIYRVRVARGPIPLNLLHNCCRTVA